MGPTWVLSASDGPHVCPIKPCYQGCYSRAQETRESPQRQARRAAVSQVVYMTAHGTTTEDKADTTGTIGFSECIKTLLFQSICTYVYQANIAFG